MRAPCVSSLDCSCAQPIMPSWAPAMVMAPMPRKRRRERDLSSGRWFIRSNGSFVVTVDFDDSFGEGLRGFLRQVVPNAALDDPVRIGLAWVMVVSFLLPPRSPTEQPTKGAFQERCKELRQALKTPRGRADCPRGAFMGRSYGCEG